MVVAMILFLVVQMSMLFDPPWTPMED